MLYRAAIVKAILARSRPSQGNPGRAEAARIKTHKTPFALWLVYLRFKAVLPVLCVLILKSIKAAFWGHCRPSQSKARRAGMPWRGRIIAPLLYMQRAALCKGGLHYAGRFALDLHNVVNKNLFIHCALEEWRNSFLRLSAAFWEFFKFFYFFKSC